MGDKGVSSRFSQIAQLTHNTPVWHRSSAKLSKEEALVKLNDETDRVIITIAGVAPQSIKVREIRNLKPKDFLGDDGGAVALLSFNCGPIDTGVQVSLQYKE